MSYPSIFNDVLGPVMRGPSSSHCAASLRIGRLCRDLMDGEIEELHIAFDPNGSLATTHASQGSDMGLCGGLLGWEADDERLQNSETALRESGIRMKIEIADIGAQHPNTYKITLRNSKEERTVTAISTGGGMIELIEVDGASTSIAGDYYETLIYTEQMDRVAELVKASGEIDSIGIRKGDASFVEVKARQFLDEALCERIRQETIVHCFKKLSPVLPVLSTENLSVPFITCDQMLAYNEGKGLALWELAVQYECERGNLAPAEVYEKMQAIVRIMQASVDRGLEGTQYADRILGCQSVKFQQQMNANKLVEGDVLNGIILSVTAIMEVKSSMGVIVAAPTAGACGALPGAVLGASAALNLPEDEAVKAMLAAGMIGVFISAHATFAAEVGGCQAECGAGAGMAAAAIVSLADGSLNQSLSAASIALQNSFGMVCDPVANRVEAPCLGKNVMAATNALSCANMSLADYDHLIPLDEVIEAMDLVGKSIPNELRCTALGGLSVTKASKAIEAKLDGLLDTE